MVASATVPYETRYPRPGWAEQSPDDWLRALAECSQRLWAKAGEEAAARVMVVGLSGHMMGAVAVDAEGRPLRPAILHSDVRATPLVEAFTARMTAQAFYDLTGQPLDPHYTVFKVLWLAKEEPGVFAAAYGFLQSKDWVRGRIAEPVEGIDPWKTTDFSDATLTGAYDVHKAEWSEEVLQAAGLDSSKLPLVLGSAEVVGHISREGARLTGLPTGVPVVAGGGDGPCATAGAGVSRPGIAYAYLGSTAWIGALSDSVPLDAQRRLFVMGHLVPGVYTAIGTAQTIGAALGWMAREVCMPDAEGRPNWAGVEELAASAAPGCHGLFFLPYLMGERAPIWDANARGVWCGLTLAHTRSHLARSVYEGVSFALRSILEAVEDAVGPVERLRLIGGGARSRFWMSMLASVLGKPLHLCELMEEATSLGAAMAAGVGAGVFEDFHAAASVVRARQALLPEEEMVAAYTEVYERWRELYPALREFMSRCCAQAEAGHKS